MPPAVLFSEPANVIGVPPRSSSEPLKIHIGCGNHHIPDYVNCDLHATSGADRVFDATGPWPFPDNCASTIYCSHTLEHMQDFWTFFREAHRVLQPDGLLQVRVPFGNHAAAWWDVTHLRPWYAESFCFLQPGYDKSVANAQHARWTAYFSVDDVMLRVSARLVPMLRWRLMRMLLIPWLDCFHNVVEEVWVALVALKTDERITQWTKLHDSNGVPGRYVAYRHHYEGRAQGSHEGYDFVTLGAGLFTNGFHAWHTGAP